MRDIFRSNKNAVGCILCLCLLLLLVLFVPQMTAADTLNSRYPGLSTGLLKSAELASLDDNTLLTFKGVAITRTELLEGLKDQTPGLRAQLEKNLIFLLEQEAVRRVLLSEAEKAGIAVTGGDENQAIQALFDDRVRALTVSENEALAFYAANKEMMGGAPFEQVAAMIGQYLLQDKQQQAVSRYIDGLGDSVAMRINGPWVEAQARLAMDNPVDKARRSGKPTLVEFGATGCVPCDMMQPILEKLREEYPRQLNVVFVHVGEEQILCARYGIQSIPVQVFYDEKGREVFRNVGFLAQTEVDKQLAAMEIRK
ncbi:MAG: thioredoxin family protein [Desulfosarcina sp.]